MASAGLGVTMNLKTGEQDFFREHCEDVVSLALHPSNRLVATGQKAAKGKAKCIDLFVWDVETKQVLANLNNFHLREVQLLAFSPDGTKLLSIGKDDDNSLAIWDWQVHQLSCVSPVDKQGVTCIMWTSNNEFVTNGPKHIKFWNKKGRNVTAQRGKFLEVSTVAYFWSQSQVSVMGTVKGNLLLYKGSSLLGKPFQAHTGMVSCLQQREQYLLSAGKDGIVNVLKMNGSSLVKESTLDMKQHTRLNPMVVSMDYQFKQTLFGMAGGDVLVQNNLNFEKVHEGHGSINRGEVWGLAVAPRSHLFATCGGDNTVRLWDVTTKKQLAINSTDIKQDARAMDWSTNGEYIVVVDVKGMVYLLDPTTLKVTS